MRRLFPTASLLYAVLLSLLPVSTSWGLDCTKLTPVDCYTQGVKQVEEAQAAFESLRSEVAGLRGELRNANRVIADLKDNVQGLKSDVPQLTFKSLTFKVYSSGLKDPDAYAECQDREHEILVGGSCLNRTPGFNQSTNVDANQVGLGPVYRSPGVVAPVTTLDKIRCQRYTNGNLQVEAFAICMRLK
jgi:hypothetical protein